MTSGGVRLSFWVVVVLSGAVKEVGARFVQIITVVSATLVPMLLHQFTNSLAGKGRWFFVVLQAFVQLLQV